MNQPKPDQYASQIVSELAELYVEATARLRQALVDYLGQGTVPEQQARASGVFAYPELRINYQPEGKPPVFSRAFGKLSEPGEYVTTITEPELFRAYLEEQLTLLLRDYKIEVQIGISEVEIPYTYVLDGGDDLDMENADPAELARLFPFADLVTIGDEIADGEFVSEDGTRPLALFDGPRTDLSLHRLYHYTGTPFEHIQQFILFTNYHRYVDEFITWSLTQLREGDEYTQLSVAGFVTVDKNTKDAEAKIAASQWHKYQMPAYHLQAKDGRGITLVNIGVGPTNAKTITEHLAVLRPQCWLMIGHCGGLRQSQRLGDYVLAHAYHRNDHVLDDVLPLDIPIPALAEIQVALAEATARVSGEGMDKVKTRLRTGTVVSKDDRNWELHYTREAKKINRSRAIAVDLESATIAANGFRFRVPYGTLLCVSDKPLHGEIKLPGAANLFYQKSVREHMLIGFEAIKILKNDVAHRLHSRKLRAFEEPPFR
ncbi:MAG: AMP nucleosidase [Robiginitomaculum sp.]|nr:MAG: AMP nucleosidase [Robiginitomaculum sp.]